MPTNLTADDVGALERRMAAATSVDSVSVDKDLLLAMADVVEEALGESEEE